MEGIMSTKRLLMLLCPIGVAIVIASAIAADPPVPGQDEASQQLEFLLKARRDTLRQIVNLLEAERRTGGRATEEPILRASNQLLDAELDLASTKAERIALREKVVTNLQQIEKITAAQVGFGVRKPEEALQATAARLKAEIQLLREKTDKTQSHIEH
jgi:hypothetical protein